VEGAYTNLSVNLLGICTGFRTWSASHSDSCDTVLWFHAVKTAMPESSKIYVGSSASNLTEVGNVGQTLQLNRNNGANNGLQLYLHNHPSSAGEGHLDITTITQSSGDIKHD
jgi:hypothetical protein